MVRACSLLLSYASLTTFYKWVRDNLKEIMSLGQADWLPTVMRSYAKYCDSIAETVNRSRFRPVQAATSPCRFTLFGPRHARFTEKSGSIHSFDGRIHILVHTFLARKRRLDARSRRAERDLSRHLPREGFESPWKGLVVCARTVQRPPKAHNDEESDIFIIYLMLLQGKKG